MLNPKAIERMPEATIPDWIFIIFFEKNIQSNVLILNDVTADLNHIKYCMLHDNIFKELNTLDRLLKIDSLWTKYITLYYR